MFGFLDVSLPVVRELGLIVHNVLFNQLLAAPHLIPFGNVDSLLHTFNSSKYMG